MDLALFDFRRFLEDHHIPYKTEGKNVTPGWLELRCTFCSDPSEHLGVSPTGGYHCWRCGSKGTIIKLTMTLLDYNYSEALSALTPYYLSTRRQEVQSVPRHHYNQNILPKEASKTFPSPHLDYLTSRNFPADIITTYDLYACWMFGEYKYRIICPVIEEGRIVNFTALAIAGQSPKYRHCPNERAHIPMGECVYNIDSVQDVAVVMEGVTDVWRFGPGGVAVMGIEFTTEQINVLIHKNLRRCFFMFDAEPLAQQKAEQMARQISSFVDMVEVVELDQGDPGELSPEAVQQIRNELGV